MRGGDEVLGALLSSSSLSYTKSGIEEGGGGGRGRRCIDSGDADEDEDSKEECNGGSNYADDDAHYDMGLRITRNLALVVVLMMVIGFVWVTVLTMRV